MDIDSVYRLYFRDVFLFLQGPVSYTHLDVYKRQPESAAEAESRVRASA